MSTDYLPIACTFYDELEAAAVKKIVSAIVYKENNETINIESRVIDFKTLNKEEFMILENGLSIRLDKIISFNGIKSQMSESCLNY